MVWLTPQKTQVRGQSTKIGPGFLYVNAKGGRVKTPYRGRVALAGFLFDLGADRCVETNHARYVQDFDGACSTIAKCLSQTNHYSRLRSELMSILLTMTASSP